MTRSVRIALLLLSFLSLSPAIWGDDASCQSPKDSTQTAICADETLHFYDQVLDSLTDRLGLGTQEVQTEWMASKHSCAADPACLKGAYLDYVKKLHATSTTEIAEDTNYYILSTKTGDDQAIFKIAKAFYEDGNKYLIDIATRAYKDPFDYDDPDSSCLWSYGSCEHTEELSLTPLDTQTVRITHRADYYYGGAHPSYTYRTFALDLAQGQKITTSAYFTPNSWDEARIILAKALLSALQQIETKTGGTYWEELDQKIPNWTAEDWDLVSFAPLPNETGPVQSFVILAGDYEFASHAASGAYNEIVLDAAPFLSYLKPQYHIWFE